MELNSLFKRCENMYFSLAIFSLIVLSVHADHSTKAAAHLTVSSQGVKGVVHFHAMEKGIHVNGTVSNLKPNSKHGFHIHEFNNLNNNCKDAGGHFNPYHKHHGDRVNYSERHVGDLGNIVADSKGVAHIDFMDEAISLDTAKDNCVLNKSVVVHANEDDLGKGSTPDSSKTGNAGGRIACGLITEAF